jgi:hypothetical protein
MLSALNTNPLRTRTDLQTALRDLIAPILPYASPGGARIRLGVTGAHYADDCADLEGFARPLWGLVPLIAGGGTFAVPSLFTRGMQHGSDPEHPEFWGFPADGNQRLVEMAALGLGLALTPEWLWEPLDAAQRANLTAWLLRINHLRVSDNNWNFFRVLVNLGLRHVGATYDQEALQRSLDRIEDFYLGDGWYNDGPAPRVQRDYYVPFAFHFYGLIYAKLAAQHDPERAATYRQRATQFAHDFIHWFAADGAALPFGRSLTYRFAQGGFWGALAFADCEALPWGVIKGLTLRHLRWWAKQPICNNDGTLSIGYAYPNLNMAEDYNSPGSPYWACKLFLPLALPETHPFWQAEELPLPELASVQVQPYAGMVLCRDSASRHVFALSSGQHATWARHGEAKYSRMAYSTALGFSVPSGPYGLVQGAYDNTLALSDDGIHYRARELPLEFQVSDDYLYSRWQPWADVTIETWLLPRVPWHIRVHRIQTGRKLWSAEGGWSVDRTGDDPATNQGQLSAEAGVALAIYPGGWSGLRDLAATRRGEIIRTSPNTNLIHPRVCLPTLHGEHEPGEHWLVCAVVGQPWHDGWETIWQTPPELHDVLQRFLQKGIE